MYNYGFYTRGVTSQLQNTPLATFVMGKEFSNRQRSSSVAACCRRYLRTNNTAQQDFVGHYKKAFNRRNAAEADSSDLVDHNLFDYRESLVRISCLNLDSTLTDQHRMKDWLP